MRTRSLTDFNLLDGFLEFHLVFLGNVDVQDAVLHPGLNLVGLGIFRQGKHLLELLIGELTAEVAAIMLLFMVAKRL